MLELDLAALRRLVEELDYDPLFVTVSGAHLYGFPSADSDVDLRGCHKLPLAEVVGLDTPRETIEPEFDLAGTEVELVSHSDARPKEEPCRTMITAQVMLGHRQAAVTQIYPPSNGPQEQVQILTKSLVVPVIGPVTDVLVCECRA